MLKIQCVACSEAWEVPDSLAGATDTCPSCKQTMRVPLKDNKATNALGTFDGFRGIQWGVDLDAVPGMEKVDEDSTGERYYHRKNDDMSLGGKLLARLTYTSWQGQFYGVSFQIADRDAIEIRECLCVIWGEPTVREFKEYTWSGVSRHGETVTCCCGENGEASMQYDRIRRLILLADRNRLLRLAAFTKKDM